MYWASTMEQVSKRSKPSTTSLQKNTILTLKTTPRIPKDLLKSNRHIKYWEISPKENSMTTNSILLRKTMTRPQVIVLTKILISPVNLDTPTKAGIEIKILTKRTILAFSPFLEEVNLWSYSGVLIFIWQFKFSILCINEWTRMIENFGRLWCNLRLLSLSVERNYMKSR